MGRTRGFSAARPQLRNFPADVEALAGDWARRSVTVEHWRDLGDWAASESYPRLVYSEVLGLYGIAKPGLPKEDGVARAAHEKLAADLAYEVGLPIPPAVLWHRPATGGVHAESVISAWAFPQPHPWTEAQAVLNERELVLATRCLSAMRVFDAWIYATDRKLENVLVSRDDAAPGAIRMAFVDYAFSLTHTWKEVNEHEPPPEPYCDAEHRRTQREVVDRIQAFGIPALTRRLACIPEPFLDHGDKRRVMSKLAERGHQLRALFGLTRT